MIEWMFDPQAWYRSRVEDWSDFFVATAGASAALGGLVIVAISVNVAEIIKYPQLPNRAGAAIAGLVCVLLASIAGLARQPSAAFGVEVIVFGIILWLLQLKSGVSTLRGARTVGRPLWEPLQVIVLGQVQALPVIVAGGLLLAGAESGILVLFAAMLAIFALTVLDAWVLLIEILR